MQMKVEGVCARALSIAESAGAAASLKVKGRRSFLSRRAHTTLIFTEQNHKLQRPLSRWAFDATERNRGSSSNCLGLIALAARVIVGNFARAHSAGAHYQSAKGNSNFT